MKHLKKPGAVLLASAALVVTAGIAPANAGPVVQPPQFTRYVWCSILPAWCTY